MIRRPPRSTLSSSSAASDVYKRQEYGISLSMAKPWVLLLLLGLLVERVLSMPLELPIESNPHIIDGSHDFKRLVALISVKEPEKPGPKGGIDLMPSQTSSSADDATSFANQARAMREALLAEDETDHDLVREGASRLPIIRPVG
eukprot:TRINITY_DN24714_c0_g1_i3.p1 TRINITY_DN24714_c0_g1~~TRINITY_DN24714_c0_g1_i3.p1  ORF type:complete len:145 (+),score=29.24 TRINITY_DN24714_c0_g1_i3:80-514(+)